MAAELAVVALRDAPVPGAAWDAFVDAANGGTLFHRLDFLAYHGARFAPFERHLVMLKGTELFGVMPLAVLDEDGRRVARSPYGASYGGPVFREPLGHRESMVVVGRLIDAVVGMGAGRLVVTLPIRPAYRDPCDTFELALLEHGFALVRREISSVVEPAATREAVDAAMDAGGRRAARKAASLGVEVRRGVDVADFWPVLARTFEKHGVPPTHTYEELAALAGTFPGRVTFDVAMLGDRPVAGICAFAVNGRLACSFYLAADPEHQEAQGLSLLLGDALARAGAAGIPAFDLGTSSAGGVGRPGIFGFKEHFGTRGCFRDTYEWTADR